MNRLWVRISLTFVGIVIFLIMIPLMINISMRNFEVTSSPEGIQAPEDDSVNNQIGSPSERFASRVSGRDLAADLLRVVAVITFISITVGTLSTRGLIAPQRCIGPLQRAA